MCVCVVVCLGWWWGDIIPYELTQKHVSAYRVVIVYVFVCACLLPENANEWLHIINNMEPVNAVMFSCGVKSVSAPAGLSHSAGGWKGDQKPGR